MIEKLLSALTAASVGLLAGLLVRPRRKAAAEDLEARNAHELHDAEGATREDLAPEQQDEEDPEPGNTGFAGPSGSPVPAAERAVMAGDSIMSGPDIHWVPDESPRPPLPPGNPKLQRAAVDELGGPGSPVASADDVPGGDVVSWSGRPPVSNE